MEIGFTPSKVTRLTGVPYSTLNIWAKNGLLPPSISAGTGTGNERVYSFSDLVALKVAFQLRKAGISTSSIKRVIQFLKETDGQEASLASARLVVRGRDVIVVKKDNELVSALSQPGQTLLSFVIDLPSTIGELTSVASSIKNFAIGVPAENLKKPSGKVTAPSQRKQKR